MGLQVEDVAFKDIHKPTFLALCSAYSLVDAVLFHPLSVAAVVAELHRTTAGGVAGATVPPPPTSFMERLRASFKANLTIRQSIEKISTAASSAGGAATAMPPSRTRRLLASAVFTGFPVTYAGLLLYDIFQMMPYNYFKSWLKEKQGEGEIPSYLPAPVVSGVFSTLMCTPFVNPPTVLFRQQVQHRCMGQPYDLKWILGTRLPAMEGGVYRVLFRGSFVGIITAVPATALGWQLYESTRQVLEKKFNSQSVYISVIAGAIAGVVGVTFTRPISVVVSRMQTDSQSHRFFATAKAILKSEGIGAFYKGYLARIMATAPRNGIFFSAYQSIITIAKRPEQPKLEDVVVEVVIVRPDEEATAVGGDDDDIDDNDP